MQHSEPTTQWNGMELDRTGGLVSTLSAARTGGENLAELAHDARNMVTALALYCDLLEEPGVLAIPYRHYGDELRLVAAASRRLVEKMVALDSRDDAHPPAGQDARANQNSPLLPFGPRSAASPVTGRPPRERSRTTRPLELPAVLIDDLVGELMANRRLLAALAGPGITLTVDAEGGALPVAFTGEDLTRILVNLVKNAAEAMPAGGNIRLSLRERSQPAGVCKALLLSIEDTGPGIPAQSLEHIFEAGFTGNESPAVAPGWPGVHRGLGLSITRSIVEGAGGRIEAANCPQGGARFALELPVRSR